MEEEELIPGLGMSLYLCYKGLRPLLLPPDYSELVLSGPADF